MEEEKLIEAVRARPALYDRSIRRYSNKDAVHVLWEEIASETNETVDALKKKWTYLRDYYRRQKNIMSTCKSGQSADKKIKWLFFDSMSFLDPCLDFEQAPTVSGLTEPILPEPQHSPTSMQLNVTKVESTASSKTASFTCKSPESMQAKPKGNRSSRELEFDPKIAQVLQESDKDEDFHGHMHFWKGLLPMLNRLNPLEAMKFKYEVHGLLIQYVEKIITEN